MNVYRPQGVVFFGIGNKNLTTAGQCRAFASEFGWDFPLGLDNANIFQKYKTNLENYVVIDPDGRIVFRAAAVASSVITWSVTELRLKQAIDATLAVPVEGLTWGGIKALYR